MAVIRIDHKRDYTVISNISMRDRRLSLKARGLLATMLSLPEEWDYTTAGLVKILSDGETSVRSALSELENAGYMTRQRVRGNNGRFSDIEYTVYEKPISDIPRQDLPHVENPLVENVAQLSTKESNKKELNTKRIKEDIEESETQRIDYNSIVHDFNRTCTNLSHVTVLSDARKKAIRARLKDITVEQMHDAFVKANASDFLTGKITSNGRTFKASFDWILKDANIAKVLDGNYDNRKAPAEEQNQFYGKDDTLPF